MPVFPYHSRFSQSLGHSSYKDFYGIVLIDEIENHLHPHIQEEITGARSSVFPKIQFIATTHRAIPILGAPKKSAFIRIDRNLEDGTTAQLIEIEVDISTYNSETVYP